MGHRAIVVLLLTANASCDKQRTDGKKPIHVAADVGFVDIVEQLITHDKNQLAVLSRDGTTPFHEAAMHNQLAVMQKLVDLGYDDINYVCPQTQETALHLAAKNNNPQMIQFLF